MEPVGAPREDNLLDSQLSGIVKLHKSECVVWETSKLGSPDTHVLNWPATQTSLILGLAPATIMESVGAHGKRVCSSPQPG